MGPIPPEFRLTDGNILYFQLLFNRTDSGLSLALIGFVSCVVFGDLATIGMTSVSRIAELAAIIAENTTIVDEYLVSNGLPTPSFDVDGPPVLPIPSQEANVLAAQDKVIASTQELHDLMKGPTEMLMGIGVINPNDVLGLHAVYRYNIFSAFPLGEAASFEAISTKCGLNEIDLRRLLRHAMTNHIFQERDGKVVHTVATKVLAQNESMRDIMGIMTEELFPGATRTVDALQKFGQARAPHECVGYTLAHNTDKGIYDYLSQLPERARRYAGAMSGFAARTNIDPLAEAFDWPSARFCVDVGGGWGPVAVALAQRFPNLSVLVEDLPHVIADGPSHVPADLPRVRFEARNILDDKEPNDGADVYLFRHVLHNFPDETCIQILRNQVNSLKSGSARGRSHILIQDAVIPQPRNELSPYKEKFRRSMDLIMLTFFGARERTLSDWTAIVKQADPRMQVSYSGAPSNIIDIVWDEAQ